MTFKYIVWNTINKEFIDYCAVVNVDLVGGKERIYLSDFRIKHTDVSTGDFESESSSNSIVSLLEHSKVKGNAYEYNELLKSIRRI